MRGYTPRDKALYWLLEDKIPLVKVLIVSNVITGLVISLFHLRALLAYTAFFAPTATTLPWTAVTYPFFNTCDGPIGLIFLLFGCYWMWFAGGSLERAWGTLKFAGYFFTMCVITALGLYFGAMALHTDGLPLIGFWLPLAGVTVAFAMLNPEQQILFWGIVPLKLKYLALLDAVLVLYQFSGSNIALGFFVLTGLAYSYWYVMPGRWQFEMPQPSRQQRGEVIRVHRKAGFFSRLNPFKRLQERKTEKWFKEQFGDPDFRDDDSK